jgi:hypothetical protein
MFPMPRGFTNIIAVGVLLAGLLGSTLCTYLLSASAGRHRLVYTDRVETNMRKEEALGIAAGAFRGLFVNLLWIRAQNLKQAGKYWEAVDLSRTITKLQPRFPRVWAFHAWNLAYNISVATQTTDERWQWVNAGIKLLRNEGIPANPNDMLLHRELAWIFLHKIQMRMDDANNYYKQAFAREWTIVVGPPPESIFRSRSRTDNTKAVAERMEQIAQAPDTLEELATKFPGAYALAQRLKSELSLDVMSAADRMLILESREQYRSALRRVQATGVSANVPIVRTDLVPLFQDEALWASGWNDLLSFIRRRTLIDDYKMEPDRMVRFTQKFGPLDWRHPAAHALYWSARGVEQGLNRVQSQNAMDYDFINTDRMAIHSIQELYRSGLIQFDILLPEYLTQFPNPDYIASYDQMIVEIMERENEQMKQTKDVDMTQRAYRFYSAGYENFLADAIVLLFRRNQLDEAKEYQLKMANWKGRNQNNIDMERIRTLPLEDYVLEQIRDRSNTPNLAVQEVFANLQSAYVFGLLAGDADTFSKKFEYAARFHKDFWDQQFRVTNVDRNSPRMGAMSTDFGEVAGQVLFDTIQQFGPVDGALMYNRAPELVKLHTFERLETLAPRDDKGARMASEFDRVFPQPRGWEQFQAERASRREADKQRGNQQLK